MGERLRQASERIAQLESERREAPGGREAPRRPTGESRDESLQRTLLLAQKFVDQTKRDSEEEAAELVGQAEERARARRGPGRGAGPADLDGGRAAPA